jgi:hypothetical protein
MKSTISLLPYPEKIRYFGTRIDLPSCNFMKQGTFWETNSFLCFGCSNESVWFRVVIEIFVIYFCLVFRLDNMWVSVLKIRPPHEKNVVLVLEDRGKFSFHDCDKMSVDSEFNYHYSKFCVSRTPYKPIHEYFLITASDTNVMIIISDSFYFGQPCTIYF